jgi:hypothetical protein
LCSVVYALLLEQADEWARHERLVAAVLIAGGGEGQIPHPDEYRQRFHAAIFDPAPIESMDPERVELLQALGLEV